MAPRTVIVGGSLSGLFCALTLIKLGYSVQVLERRTPDQLQDQGGGLKLGEDIVDFLAGFDTSIINESTYLVRNTKNIVFDQDGREIDERTINVPSTSWGSLYQILRKNFDEIASQTESTYVEGAKVTNVREQDKSSVLVEYELEGIVQTQAAALVIGADGASSKTRQIFAPGTERFYSGYVGWRGLVPFSALRGFAPDSLIYNRTWHFGKDYKVIAYSVPAQTGAGGGHESQINYVWYHNTPEEHLDELLTDMHGVQHPYAVASGNMRPSAIEKLHDAAKHELPEGLRNLVLETQKPFVQAITDLQTPQNSFLDGKVLLVGDATAIVRPHVGTGTGQAIFHANMLGELARGTISSREWSEQTLLYSSVIYQAGQDLGDTCQRSKLNAYEKMQKFRNRLVKLSRDLDKFKELFGPMERNDIALSSKPPHTQAND